jgi:predicted metal-dependent HD superfamily phosphohydrolase
MLSERSSNTFVRCLTSMRCGNHIAPYLVWLVMVRRSVGGKFQTLPPTLSLEIRMVEMMDETLWDMTDPYSKLEQLRLASGVSDLTMAGVLNRYAQLHRHYHGLYHIAFLYALQNHFVELGQAVPNPEIYRAILYHDAVYDPLSKTNEYDSAELYYSHGGERDDWVYNAIMATADHSADRLMMTADDDEREWFVGLDLVLLACPWPMFVLNNKLIRLEYSQVSDADWNGGRTSFTKKLSEQRIYRHPLLCRLFEDRAHENISKLLENGV